MIVIVVNMMLLSCFSWVKFDCFGHYLYTGIANGSTIQRDDSVHPAHVRYPYNYYVVRYPLLEFLQPLSVLPRL